MGLETAALAFDAASSFGTVGAYANAAGVAASALAPTVATAATIGSSAISALGSIQQSRAAAASAGYNAKVAANNAQIQTQNAQFAGAEGEQNTAAAGAKTKAAIGATLANEAGSGIDINSGSNVNVRESEAKLGMLNALNIRSEAARTAYGYTTQSASDIGQSQLYRSQQVSAQTGGYLTAGADVLSGAGNAAKYTNWLNNGGF
jgi:hypothetical protein